MSVWLTVIGMHPDGRLAEPDRARAALDAADEVFGAERHLEAAGVPAERRRPWPTPFSEGLAALHARKGTPTVVVATGDPMHFGIGATLASHVPADEMTVLPAPSAFSLAAARLGWPLDGVACVSLHGRSVDALARALQPGTRILALTSDAGTIATAVSLLRSQGFGDSDIIVLEAMGTERERRTDIEPTDIVGGGFYDLTTPPFPGSTTMPSPTTASSPSARCAPSPWPRSRRRRARCCGTSAPAPARSPSSGCAPPPMPAPSPSSDRRSGWR